jgi:hypothetical protein
LPRDTVPDQITPAHANPVAHVVDNQRRRSPGHHNPATLYATPTVQ